MSGNKRYSRGEKVITINEHDGIEPGTVFKVVKSDEFGYISVYGPHGERPLLRPQNVTKATKSAILLYGKENVRKR